MFKVKQIEAKLGMTIEINGTWTRIDRGMVMENLNLDDVTAGELKGTFDKCQALLEQEIVKVTQKLK